MDEVGELRPGDRSASVDRRTRHYADALSLAKHVLEGQGRLFEHGSAPTWTFLIPTPRMVEDGLRNMLVKRLAPEWDVRKRGLQLEGSTLTFNPDLVFGHGLAVGDVKYKLLGADWNRSDLYQVVTFATAYRSRHAVVLGFQRSDRQPSQAIQVGDVRVAELASGRRSGATRFSGSRRTRAGGSQVACRPAITIITRDPAASQVVSPEQLCAATLRPPQSA